MRTLTDAQEGELSEAIGGLLASTAQLLGFALAHDAEWATFRDRHPGVRLPTLCEVSGAIQRRVEVLERYTLDEPAGPAGPWPNAG